MAQNTYTKNEIETTIVVGVMTPGINQNTFNEYLDELTFLIDTAGGIVSKKFAQKLQYPDPKYYIGSGKLSEIAEYIEENQISLVVFDDELSPSQIKNIEKVLQCKIIDRTNLILDIFAKRARTANAKTQVELAQYQYLLPRLTRMWTHLEKQRGGIGMRGPGEKEIETDRRIIRDKISLLKEKLIDIDKQKRTQRKNRQHLVRVALVGYTNVGKSTLMNLISKSDVFAENKLFATLDTTVRKVVIGNLPFLLSDTVGFIRKLPHGLIESFKSTLDEVREADIVAHVVDIAHSAYEKHIDTVNETLKEIGAGDKKKIMIFNKTDAYLKEYDPYDLSENRKPSQKEIEQVWNAKVNSPSIFISATQKINIDKLKKILYHEVVKIHKTKYPYNNFLY